MTKSKPIINPRISIERGIKSTTESNMEIILTSMKLDYQKDEFCSITLNLN